jgi:hypothetical protein
MLALVMGGLALIVSWLAAMNRTAPVRSTGPPRIRP